ncbi:MAG: GNAT family N-acetyltransferase [Thermoguttaceae bacterium]
MITWMNKIAHRNRFYRFWGILQDWCWISKYVILSRSTEPFDEPIDGRQWMNESNLTWRLATESDILAMFQDGNYDISDKNRDFFLSFIESDSEYMLLGIIDDIIVTYAICASKQKRMYGKSFSLKDDESFAMICFTPATFRGRGLGPICLEAMADRCRTEKMKTLYIDISVGNQPSLRSAEKAKFRATDSGYYIFNFCKHSFLFPFGSLRNRFSGQ